MNRGDSVRIERVGNGFVVRPDRESGGCLYVPTELLVFNDLGASMTVRDDVNIPSLLRFLEAHFTDPRQ